MFNVDAAKIGGLTMIKVGRLTLSFSISPVYRRIGAGSTARWAAKEERRERQRSRAMLKAMKREAEAYNRGFQRAEQLAAGVR